MQARGAKILLLNCTPALCPMYERIGFVRKLRDSCWHLGCILPRVATTIVRAGYKPAYCDVGGMGLQVTPTLGSGRDGEHSSGR